MVPIDLHHYLIVGSRADDQVRKLEALLLQTQADERISFAEDFLREWRRRPAWACRDLTYLAPAVDRLAPPTRTEAGDGEPSFWILATAQGVGALRRCLPAALPFRVPGKRRWRARRRQRRPPAGQAPGSYPPAPRHGRNPLPTGSSWRGRWQRRGKRPTRIS